MRYTLLTLFLMGLVGCSLTSYRFRNPQQQVQINPIDNINNLLLLHNDVRLRMNLEALVADPRLMQVAQTHADYMAALNSFSHSGPNGNSPTDRVKAQGVEVKEVAENLAMTTSGNGLETYVFDRWYTSTNHRQNIMGNFNKLGLGKAVAKDGTVYWCAVYVR